MDLHSPQGGDKNRHPDSAVARDRKLTLAVSVCICILFAGVAGIDYSRQIADARSDARKEAAERVAVDPLGPDFKGYVPADAVIPTKEGIYVGDGEGKFRLQLFRD